MQETVVRKLSLESCSDFKNVARNVSLWLQVVIALKNLLWNGKTNKKRSETES